jgi:xylulokinase
VLFVSNEKFRPNAGRAVHAFCHAVPDTWHQMGVILSATASLEWLSAIPRPCANSRELSATNSWPISVLFLPICRAAHACAGAARGLFMHRHETVARC